MHLFDHFQEFFQIMPLKEFQIYFCGSYWWWANIGTGNDFLPDYTKIQLSDILSMK